MPHVDIKCFAGRTEEQKRECAARIADVIANTLDCETSSVSVAIKDVKQSEWKEEVWDKYIIPDGKYMYKKPGYVQIMYIC